MKDDDKKVHTAIRNYSEFDSDLHLIPRCKGGFTILDHYVLIRIHFFINTYPDLSRVQASLGFKIKTNKVQSDFYNVTHFWC
jgi:hypothetical protein